MTAICAAAFFCTSILLSILAGNSSQSGGTILDALDEAAPAAIVQDGADIQPDVPLPEAPLETPPQTSPETPITAPDVPIQ